MVEDRDIQLGSNATLFVLAATLQTHRLAATVLTKSISSIYRWWNLIAPSVCGL